MTIRVICFYKALGVHLHFNVFLISRHLLSTSGYVEVKQRAGCLSYMEDKLGYHSQLARTLTQSETIPWDPPSTAIVSFTSESTLRHFCDNYLTPGVHGSSNIEARLQQMLTRVTYDCVIKEKLVVIPIITTLIKVSVYSLENFSLIPDGTTGILMFVCC